MYVTPRGPVRREYPAIGVMAVLPLLQVPDEVLELGADPVPRRDLAEPDAQGGDLPGQVLGVGDRPLVLLAVLLQVDPVPVVLPVLREQDQRGRVGSLERQLIANCSPNYANCVNRLPMKAMSRRTWYLTTQP